MLCKKSFGVLAFGDRIKSYFIREPNIVERKSNDGMYLSAAHPKDRDALFARDLWMVGDDDDALGSSAANAGLNYVAVDATSAASACAVKATCATVAVVGAAAAAPAALSRQSPIRFQGKSLRRRMGRYKESSGIFTNGLVVFESGRANMLNTGNMF